MSWTSVARAAAWASILVCLLLEVPPVHAGAEVRERTYEMTDPGHLRAWANVTLTLPEAAAVRGEADSNGDGSVSDAERSSYESYLRSKSDEDLQETSLVRLDGQAPASQRTLTAKTRNLLGSTTSSAPVEYDLEFAVEFGPLGPDDLHRLGRQVGPGDQGPIRVSVPPQHVAIYGNGIDDWRTSPDGRTVTGRNDGATDVSVYFAHEAVAERYAAEVPDAGGEPGAGGGGGSSSWFWPSVGLVLLGGFAGTAWYLRRRG